MSRDISATNLAEINASHLHPVLMVHLAFDTPVYVHSNIGTIEWSPVATATSNSLSLSKGAVEPGLVANGNEIKAAKGAVESAAGIAWLGVGGLGGVTNPTETEALRPTSLTLTLSGVDSTYITEALTAGNYGDTVTIYEGYRNDDGTLKDDPWIVWKGFYEFGSIVQDESSTVQITLQHDLAVLEEINGGRYTDEDQQKRFSGDDAFKYISNMATIQLEWGNKTIQSSSSGGREPWNGDRR